MRVHRYTNININTYQHACVHTYTHSDIHTDRRAPERGWRQFMHEVVHESTNLGVIVLIYSNIYSFLHFVQVCLVVPTFKKCTGMFILLLSKFQYVYVGWLYSQSCCVQPYPLTFHLIVCLSTRALNVVVIMWRSFVQMQASAWASLDHLVNLPKSK